MDREKRYNMFGSWGYWFAQFGIKVVMIIAVLGVIACCFIPCIRYSRHGDSNEPDRNNGILWQNKEEDNIHKTDGARSSGSEM